MASLAARPVTNNHTVYFENPIVDMHGPKVSTTAIKAMGCRQLLPLSITQVKVNHCRKPHCRNGVVDRFGHGLEILARISSL